MNHSVSDASIASESMAFTRSRPKPLFGGFLPGPTSAPTSPICVLPGQWKRGDLIGQGAFAHVYRAMDLNTMEVFAVKEAVYDAAHRDQLNTELNLYKKLRHPNVINCLGHDFTDQCLHIYLELADGGSIASMLSQFGPFPVTALAKATSGILSGLHYLHN